MAQLFSLGVSSYEDKTQDRAYLRFSYLFVSRLLLALVGLRARPKPALPSQRDIGAGVHQQSPTN